MKVKAIISRMEFLTELIGRGLFNILYLTTHVAFPPWPSGSCRKRNGWLGQLQAYFLSSESYTLLSIVDTTKNCARPTNERNASQKGRKSSLKPRMKDTNAKGSSEIYILVISLCICIQNYALKHEILS